MDEKRFKAVIWYKRGRSRQRWFYAAEGSFAYCALMLADMVAAWSVRPTLDVVGTVIEL